jgi:protein gp37
MSDRSAIEWTDSTWNPIRARNLTTGKIGSHCEHATTGCEHCYAEGINKRLGTGLPFKPGHRADIEIFLDEKMLLAPLCWKRPRRIFVGSMTDLFADFVTDEMLDRIFAVMALAPQHTFQLLTKRPERMRKYLTPTTEIPVLGRLPLERVHFEAQSDEEPWPSLKKYGNLYSLYCSVPWPLPNVWCGVSVERQEEADERIPLLLQTPAAVRFISAEPLLAPIDLTEITHAPGHALHALWGLKAETDGTAHYGPKLDWIICGGESGPHARPMHPDWARSLRDQCQAADAAYFFKQWGQFIPESCAARDHQGAHTSQTLGRACIKQAGEIFWSVGKRAAGRLLDGREHNDMPGCV